MGSKPILFVIGGLVIGIGAGVAIGWFSKPETESPDSPSNSADLLNEFMSYVDPKRLGDNLREISKHPHYATSDADNKLSELIRQQWDKTLDSAWIVDYTIMHQWPNAEKSFAVLKENGGETKMKQFEENIPDDEKASTLMFYNAYSPPTGFEIDDNGNSKEVTIKATKLVYGHYCNATNVEEINKLVPNIFQDAIVLCKYTKGGRADKPRVLKPYGAQAVLMFSDPKDYSGADEKGFPHDAGLPMDSVQRGSSKYLRGDPTTPGWPSYPGVYERSVREILEFTKNEIHGPHIWAPLPQQPISVNDAQILLSKLPGQPVPEAWKSETVLELGNYGGDLEDGATFELQIAPKYERADSPDIFGFLEGSEYPDEYIFIGNHHDAWVHGTVDPGAGTTTLFEVSEVFQSMNYRPKRSIIFCSWGSEEHGLIGTQEFVEEFYSVIRERAVAYINSDMSFQDKLFFKALATPILNEFVYDVTKMVPDHNDPKKTVYDLYLENQPTEDGSRPYIGQAGLGSDYAPFAHMLGVPIIDVGFIQKERKIPIMSTYHTAYDHFEYAETFADPGWQAAATVTKVVGGFLIKLGEADSIPVTAQGTVDLVDSLHAGIDDDMKTYMGEGQLLALESAVEKFKSALDKTSKEYETDKSHRIQNRLLKHNMHLIDSMCCHPIQLDLKHILTSPIQEKGPATFPGMSDYYQFIKHPELNTWVGPDSEPEKIVEFQKQVTAVITKLNTAADYLNMEKPFFVRQ